MHCSCRPYFTNLNSYMLSHEQQTSINKMIGRKLISNFIPFNMRQNDPPTIDVGGTFGVDLVSGNCMVWRQSHRRRLLRGTGHSWLDLVFHKTAAKGHDDRTNTRPTQPWTEPTL